MDPSLPHSLAPSLPHSLACYAMVHHISSHATGQTHACSQQYGPEGTHVQLRQRPAMTLAAIGDAERSVFGASSSPPSTILRLHPLQPTHKVLVSSARRSSEMPQPRIPQQRVRCPRNLPPAGPPTNKRELLWCARPSSLRLAPQGFKRLSLLFFFIFIREFAPAAATVGVVQGVKVVWNKT